VGLPDSIHPAICAAAEVARFSPAPLTSACSAEDSHSHFTSRWGSRYDPEEEFVRGMFRHQTTHRRQYSRGSLLDLTRPVISIVRQNESNSSKILGKPGLRHPVPVVRRPPVRRRSGGGSFPVHSRIPFFHLGADIWSRFFISKDGATTRARQCPSPVSVPMFLPYQCSDLDFGPPV
jgi:hypothetical protein